MKKILLALVISCVMLLGFVVAVSADNGPHGGFTASTDACANCHRAHSAQMGGNALIVQSSVEALCLSCHDGNGAGTDVENGIYHTATGQTPAEGIDGGSLFAGGFTNALMATTWSGKVTADATFNATSRATSSHHQLGPNGIVYGSGAISNLPVTASATSGYFATETSLTLECTSCHDPHGNAGYQMAANAAAGTWSVVNSGTVAAPVYTKVPTYRLLRFQPQGSSGFTPPSAVVNWSGGAFPSGPTTGWTVPDNFTASTHAEWYTIGTSGAFALGDYNPGGSPDNAYNVTDTNGNHNYRPVAANLAYFCAQCHDRYFRNTSLRNATDTSAYCGAYLGTPNSFVAGDTIVYGLATLTLNAPDSITGLHPTHPTECIKATNLRSITLVVNGTSTAFPTGTLTIWGDDRPTGDTVHAYQHNSGDVMRVSMDGTTWTATMTAPTGVGRACAACHVAHGTASVMTTTAGQANQVYARSFTINPATAVASSTLLRMDNRSLCLRCHASDVGFTVGP